MEPGTVVLGPFYANGNTGVGVIVASGRQIWTRVGEGYVPVKVIKGDRASGGYKPGGLEAIPQLTYKP